MTKDISKPEIANRDPLLLCPWFAAKAASAIEECNEAGYLIRMFEGYRAPVRQDWLYGQGRTRQGKIVTRARAWQSWHQYGVAMDIAFWDGRKWYWPSAENTLWDRVTNVLESHGFEPLKFERPHFEITAGMRIDEAAFIAKKSGITAVWDLIQKRGGF